MSREDLKKTIILNARTLISHDADFAKFAARILLTYIYEEVLDWDIVKDGIKGVIAQRTLQQVVAAERSEFVGEVEKIAGPKFAWVPTNRRFPKGSARWARSSAKSTGSACSSRCSRPPNDRVSLPSATMLRAPVGV